jgi:hypothetical protein
MNWLEQERDRTELAIALKRERLTALEAIFEPSPTQEDEAWELEDTIARLRVYADGLSRQIGTTEYLADVRWSTGR